MFSGVVRTAKMGAFNKMPSDFPVENWNILPCPYGPRWNKCLPLPPEMSLSLPQHGIISGQLGTSGLAYISVGHAKRI